MDDPAGNKTVRGPGFCPIQDEILAYCYISESESPTKGAAQKVTDFWDGIAGKYNSLIGDQALQDSLFFSKVLATTRDMTIIPAGGYVTRNGQSLCKCFHDIVGPRVAKFVGVIDRTDIASGDNEEGHLEKCLVIFEQHYPKLGSFHPFLGCYDRLKDTPKFASFIADLKGKETKDKVIPRPIGGKRAKLKEENSKLINQAVDKAYSVSSGSVGGVATSSLNGVNADIAVAVKDIGRHMGKFAATMQNFAEQSGCQAAIVALPSPQRCEAQTLQFNGIIAALRREQEEAERIANARTKQSKKRGIPSEIDLLNNESDNDSASPSS